MRLVKLLVLLLGTPAAFAQQEVLLWPDTQPPYAKDIDNSEAIEDCWGGVRCAHRVTVPTLTLYPAADLSQPWVLIVPGGGYNVVAIFHEGAEIAAAFVEHGFSAAVLKYRVPDVRTATKPEQVPFVDFRRAMALLRHEQQRAGTTNGKIGIVGFSASGHLAVYSMVHPDPDPQLNVDFAILAYGTSRLNPINKDWLEKNLYYRPLTESEERAETLLSHVTESTPPVFLVHAVNDDVSHYTESTMLADTLRAHGVDAELHLFAKGGHGFGPGRDSDGTSQWLDLAANWLRRATAE